MTGVVSRENKRKKLENRKWIQGVLAVKQNTGMEVGLRESFVKMNITKNVYVVGNDAVGREKLMVLGIMGG